MISYRLLAAGTIAFFAITGCSSDSNDSKPDINTDSPIASVCETVQTGNISELAAIANNSRDAEPSALQLTSLQSEFNQLPNGCPDAIPQVVGMDDTPSDILSRTLGAE